jgi:hypothetical protein
MVLLGRVRASFVRASSGLSPHARIISLRASILLSLFFGRMLRLAERYMPCRYSMTFILMSARAQNSYHETFSSRLSRFDAQHAQPKIIGTQQRLSLPLMSVEFLGLELLCELLHKLPLLGS